VFDIQETVEHIVAPICADGVRSLFAKLRPSIETIAPEEVPMFRTEKDTTGASYVNTFILVPTIDAIVRPTELPPPVPPEVSPQMMSELLTQLEVAHTVAESRALTE
jgi:hypothetical protein